MVSLENQLSKFTPHNNFEFEGRLFMTNVAALGPEAYLHIIFKAANEEIQQMIIEPLGLPPDLRDFYRRYNGAHLFSDMFSLYGFRPVVYQLNRVDRRQTMPYDILDVNREYTDDLVASGIILIGSYGYDRSEVYVDKSTNSAHCAVGGDLGKTRATWPSFEMWLTEEIARLSNCFDEHGNRLVELEETLPGGT
jgi:hypothetical protein